MREMASSELDRQLKLLYYQPGPGLFTSAANLYRLAKEKGLPVTRAAVKSFLQRSHVRNIVQPLQNLRNQPYRKYVVKRMGKTADIDLMEIKDSKFKFIFILTEYFSGKVFALPQINKTAAVTAKTLQKLYRQSPEARTEIVLHDAGKEFTNLPKTFPNIKFQTTYGDQKAHFSESSIMRLRKKFRALEVAYDIHDYATLLDDALLSINEAHQQRIGYSSNQVAKNRSSWSKVFQRRYGKYLDQTVQSDLLAKREPKPFKLNSLVRVQRILPFWRKAGNDFSTELFRIISIDKSYFPHTYKLKSALDGEPIEGQFYHNQLRVAEPGADKRQRIETVLQTDKKNRRYLVKLRGLPTRLSKKWIDEKDYQFKRGPFLHQ